MSCLSPATLKDYLANNLPEAERSEVESHLSQCSSCRHRLVQQHQQRSDIASPQPRAAVPAELLETARTIGRRQGRRQEPRWVGSLAAAALVALAVGIGGWQLDLWQPAAPNAPRTGAPGSDTMRSGGPGAPLTGTAQVTASGPEDGAVVAGEAISLSWSVEHPTAVLDTTLTLVDGLGNILWQGAVEGTSWRLDPGRLEAVPPGPFYWFVTVRLDDGTTAETELRSLRRP